MSPPQLILVAAPDCHLCAHAREVLDQLAAEAAIGWSEVSEGSPDGSRLAQGAPPLRPLLFSAEGPLLATGRLSAKRLRRDLGSTPTVTAAEARHG